MVCWMTTGERQATKIRSKYLRSVLRQDVGFFDTQISTAEVINAAQNDSQIVQEAISEKVGTFFISITTFMGGLLVSFLLTWKLTLVLLPFVPLLMLPGILYGKAVIEFTRLTTEAFTEAAVVSEQALSSIRTVYSFAGESRTLESFSRALEAPLKIGLKQGLTKGLSMGSYGLGYLMWAAISWYGNILIGKGEANGGNIFIAGFGLTIGGWALGNCLRSLKAFSEGCVAAHRLFEMIARVPTIDSDRNEGKVLENVEGTLQLQDVSFVYPSRPEQIVLNGLSLDIPAGQTVALVGSSGCGKSTVIALLERFYDPLQGRVLLDGTDIKELQLKWFRNQISLVSQEPVLFATSIRENILYGKEDAKMEEIVSAANLSNAHEFVQRLILQYDTLVGERGAKMSGGQKQRIAIARAIIKDPKILLLDEATSALDSESELIVQEALERATIGRTTVVIAHRLSTIRNADLIIVLQKGAIVELGSHEKLMKEGSAGVYSALVSMQQSSDHDNGSSKKKDIVNLQLQAKFTEATSDSFSNFSSSIKGTSVDGLLHQATKNRKNKSDISKLPPFRNLLALCMPEWKQGILGLFGSVIFGFIQPFFVMQMGSLLKNFYDHKNSKNDQKISLHIVIFVCLAATYLIANLVQHYNYAVMGEYLTKRIREGMLAAILCFEVGWFDREENLSGAICSRLSTDARMFKAFVVDQTAIFIQTLTIIVVAIVISAIASWRLTLVMVITQPLIILCFYVRKIAVQGSAQKFSKAREGASQVASEAVSHHRTITAFCSQDRVLQIFHQKLKNQKAQKWKQVQTAGLSLGTSELLIILAWALAFWYAAALLKQGKVTIEGMFQSVFLIMSSGRTVSDAGALSEDFARSKATLASILDIINRKTEIDANSDKAQAPGRLEGSLQLLQVSFAYPSRPDDIIFQNLSLTVHSGQAFAVIGHSGSGKSTIVSLIQRFYDPISGMVLIDGKDIKTLHLRSVRDQIGLVSQEPVLFSSSIRENIAYGKDNATEEEIVAAAQAANAHDFISALPKGYATQAGEHGHQLSGGQKQRICIARAILKDAAILLLDEATSALDSQSEQVVQETLNRMMIGRSSIVIAHRLSTIQNVDMIAVLQNGSIVEQGTHKELYAKGEGGIFYSLINLQQVFSVE